jgi:hypothetical protein
MLLIGIVVWVALCFVVASAAGQRGRNSLGWFLFAVLLSPLLAGFALLLFPERKDDPSAIVGRIYVEGEREPATVTLRRAVAAAVLVALLAAVGWSYFAPTS